jgi:hypothetical protein
MLLKIENSYPFEPILTLKSWRVLLDFQVIVPGLGEFLFFVLVPGFLNCSLKI